MDRDPYEGKEIVFHELHRHFKTGELSVDDDGKIAIYLDVVGSYKSEYWSPLELTNYNFVTVMKGSSEVTNPKTSYNEKEYLDAIKQRCESPAQKRARLTTEEDSLIGAGTSNGGPAIASNHVAATASHHMAAIQGNVGDNPMGAGSSNGPHPGTLNQNFQQNGAAYWNGQIQPPQQPPALPVSFGMMQSTGQGHFPTTMPPFRFAGPSPTGMFSQANGHGHPMMPSHVPQQSTPFRGNGLGTLSTQRWHLNAKQKRSPAKPIGNPLRLKLTCLQQGNAEFAVIDEGELLTLRRGGMGEKTVMIPPGSERYDAFPALRAAFDANKKGFYYASRKGRGLTLERKFEWNCGYNELKRADKFFVVPSYDLDPQEAPPGQMENEEHYECQRCHHQIPDSEYILHVKLCGAGEEN